MTTTPPTFLPSYHDEDSVRRIQYRQIGKTDMVASALSFGASSLGGVFRQTDDSESERLVQAVVKAGINYIDTAPWYGQGRSEVVLGRALREVPRQAYYLATKVGRYELEVGGMFDFSRERVTRSVTESLERLGLDYIDLIQVHDVEFCQSLEQIVNFTIPALVKLKEEGKVRYIGLTGYSLDTMKRLISLLPPNTIDTILTYCRCTLVDRCLLDQMDFFTSRSVGVINASPVSMGLLSVRGPPAWHPATSNIKDTCSRAATYCHDQGEDITDLAILWSLTLKNIPTTLISTANINNMMRNIELVKTKMTEKQIKVAEDLERKFFGLLPQQNWENIEVNRYWRDMNDSDLKQNTDI